jgi:hypothetical protein
MAGANIFSPAIFENSIGSTIEAGILSKMVEPFTRTIEAGSDVMAAIVGNAPIRFPSIGLASSTFRLPATEFRLLRPR